MNSDSRLILSFFTGRGGDHMGRTLAEILAWDDRALEDVHDYIQWLFPIFTQSPFNDQAPTLTDDVVAAFTKGPNKAVLKDNLLRAFERMLGFYGFRLEASAADQDTPSALSADAKVVRAENWPKASTNWLHPGNHNHRRITRILRCLRALGFKPLATAFLQQLEANAREYRDAISANTVVFWREAAGVASAKL